MDAKLQRRIQRYGWDKAAPYYERFWQAQLAPAQRRLFEYAALQPGERVLDVACGTGLVTFPAAEMVGADGAVVATDLSEAMVRHVSDEAARRRMPHVTAVRVDAEALDFPDGAFDVVLCALGLMYVASPLAALNAAWRVLQPGGRVVAAVWGARSSCGWAEVFPIVDARVQSDVCPMFFQLGAGGALAHALGAARFEPVQSDRLSTVLEYGSAEDACGAAFAGGPVALAYSKFDARTRTEAHAEYLASIERWRTATGYTIPGEFVVARGDKPR